MFKDDIADKRIYCYETLIVFHIMAQGVFIIL